jgi:hypothetical protein
VTFVRALGVLCTTLCLGTMVGCTSLGQAGRTQPLVARPLTTSIGEVGFDGDDHALARAVERFLEEEGVAVQPLAPPRELEVSRSKEHSYDEMRTPYVYDEVQTRYVVRVRSRDLERCTSEGSRQMDFSLTVIDYRERSHVFLAEGEEGCRDTIVRTFAKWLTASGNEGM